VSGCDRHQDQLEAYSDGELSGFARRRVARHVAACAACRAEIEQLREIASLVRDAELDSTPSPDLWAGIAARLPEIDADLARRAAPARVRTASRGRRRWSSLLGPLPVGVGGLAAAAVAVTLWLRPAAVPAQDNVVEELDAMGRPVAVLPSDDKSTIIWVLDPTPVASAEESSGALL
jgi:anti-sigma factor RsiW